MRSNETYMKTWNTVYESFTQLYPEYADRVIRWWPSYEWTITLKMDDGFNYTYCLIDDKFYKNRDHNFDTDNLSEKDLLIIVGRNIREKLRLIGCSQDTLAERTGITTAMINRYVKGKAAPGLISLYKIANALECSINELITVREGGNYR